MPAKRTDTPPDSPLTPVTKGIIGMSGHLPATVPTRRYTAPVGWRIGDIAPADAYRSLDETSTPYGPVYATNPGGHATQLATKGCPISAWARREMDDAGHELGD
ncbi:hypothetical protein [Saccharothrix sp. ST-888]|uniref:hypothetical protein n=1 Tax=Saccharothrix sp. ST-888 TaxID=1427391 RepID=UPI00062009BB|nr:hypothetical protein [Saccharothrix sp. ST-888]KJK55641.1 hypothetical protein UK12_27355 [Saccharothrix sp. ST-888]